MGTKASITLHITNDDLISLRSNVDYSRHLIEFPSANHTALVIPSVRKQFSINGIFRGISL